jgi:hypothetical protein
MGRGGLDMRLRSYRPLAGWARSIPAVGLFAFVLCDLSSRPAVVASSVYDKGATIGVYGKYKLRLRCLNIMLILFSSLNDVRAKLKFKMSLNLGGITKKSADIPLTGMARVSQHREGEWCAESGGC